MVSIAPAFVGRQGCVSIIVVTYADAVGAWLEVACSESVAYLLVVERLGLVGDDCVPTRDIIHVLHSTGAQCVVGRDAELDVPRGGVRLIRILTGGQQEGEAEEYGQYLFQEFKSSRVQEFNRG